MTQQRSRLTVVAPAYDEEEVLPYFHRELCRVLGALGDEYDWEILYVDDGSGDGTLGLLRGWAALDARVRYVSFSRNFGHQAAFTAGLEINSSPIAEPEPVSMLSTPLGKPASLIASTNRTVQRGAREAGLITTLLPATSAGAIFQAGMATGKFQGVNRETTPRGFRKV